MNSMYDAPRFHAYLTRIEDRSVFVMSRQDWQQLEVQQGAPVSIDVRQTPMGRIVNDASVVAAVAENFSTANATISIYRFDPNDAPTPYNLDKYQVWEELPAHREYKDIVRAASTTDDANLRGYLKENVFIVKEEKGEDHWLASTQLPGIVRSIVKST